MNSPRISIPRQYGASDRRRSELRMPLFLQRLFKFPQMDFDMAVWEMTHLLIAPKKVFKSIYYHKQTKNTWHRPDPSFTYLLCLFLLLTSFAWSLAYTPAFSNVVKLALMFVFVHFLAGSVALSTAAYFLVGRFLGPGVPGLPGRRRQQGLFGPPNGARGDMLEFGYCFDVQIRAFLPVYVLLYIIQFVLLPVIRHDNRASEFFGNFLYLAAATYWTVITFLGKSYVPGDSRIPSSRGGHWPRPTKANSVHRLQCTPFLAPYPAPALSDGGVADYMDGVHDHRGQSK